MQSVIPVILSGGSGSRLWPLSRKHYPKQLLKLIDGEPSLLQSTALRLKQLQPSIVVCNEEHRFMVAEQLAAIDSKPDAIILEPIGRNTAPAITVAALQANLRDDDAIIAVFPADHVIGDQTAFESALEAAVEAAQEDNLVTFGVMPTSPETGYGYIKAGASHGSMRPVASFVEKPNHELAEKYFRSGDYFWNSGMFVFKASVYLQALNQFDPEIIKQCEQALKKANIDLDFIRLDREAFEACPDDSVDYALMEKADNVVVVPLDAGWNDVGGWNSLWNAADKDEHNNVFNGEVIALDTQNTFTKGSGNKLVALVGLDNIVVVDTKDALLVAKKDKVQLLKSVVEQLKIQNRSEHLVHKEVFRPWGSYESLEQGVRYQVKHITVKPGASLSLQLHHHRAEHWIVVTGSALIQLGESQQLLTENQSVYIPIGEKHRLTNPGKLPLQLIEVQSGGYLGEDDIVRFEDLYERS